MKRVLIFSLLSVFLFSNCKKDVPEVSEDFVVNTFKSELQSGVDSIQTINNQHPLISKALDVDFFCSSTKSVFGEIDPIYGIYYYSDSTAALLVSNVEGDFVYAYIFNSVTQEFVDSYLAEINVNPTDNMPILRITSIITGKEILAFTHKDLNSKGWGSCMKDAISLLYNDWDNDAGGTFACWVTGHLCAVGGAIACGIKQL